MPGTHPWRGRWLQRATSRGRRSLTSPPGDRATPTLRRRRGVWPSPRTITFVNCARAPTACAPASPELTLCRLGRACDSTAAACPAARPRRPSCLVRSCGSTRPRRWGRCWRYCMYVPLPWAATSWGGDGVAGQAGLAGEARRRQDLRARQLYQARQTGLAATRYHGTRATHTGKSPQPQSTGGSAAGGTWVPRARRQTYTTTAPLQPALQLQLSPHLWPRRCEVTEAEHERNYRIRPACPLNGNRLFGTGKTIQHAFIRIASAVRASTKMSFSTTSTINLRSAVQY